MSVVCGIKLDADHVFNKEQNSTYIGRRFETTRSGWAEVIDGDFSYLRIRFDNTGNERVLSPSSVVSRTARDLYAPTILGVACRGNASKVDNTPQYKMWHHMIERCYNPKEPYYHIYGGAGVRVSERWRVFEFFLEDLKVIERIHPPNHTGLLELDKDLKQLGVPLEKRIYSLETCALVSKEINQLCRTSSVFFDAYHEDGRVEKNMNMNLFTKKHKNIKRTGAQNCLSPSKRQSTYKGWTLEKIEPTKEVVWDIVHKLNSTEEIK